MCLQVLGYFSLQPSTRTSCVLRLARYCRGLSSTSDVRDQLSAFLSKQSGSDVSGTSEPLSVEEQQEILKVGGPVQSFWSVAIAGYQTSGISISCTQDSRDWFVLYLLVKSSRSMVLVKSFCAVMMVLVHWCHARRLMLRQCMCWCSIWKINSMYLSCHHLQELPLYHEQRSKLAQGGVP